MTLDIDLTLALINRFQHDMPVCARPYQHMADVLGCSEQHVLDCLDALNTAGVLSRIGPVFDHRRAGFSTLAAVCAPLDRIDDIALIINQYHEVNHNYERTGQWNLWFVVTAPSQERLVQVLHDLEQQTGLTVLNLPMIRPFHIDLGFPINRQDIETLA